MLQMTSKEFFQSLEIVTETVPEISYGEDYIWGDTSNPNKLQFLTTLVSQKFHNKKVLEFGTYRGTTTYNIATNLTTGTIYTVDCGYEELKELIKKEESEHKRGIKYSPYSIGEVYKKKLKDISCVKQIIGNTTTKETADQLIKNGPYDLIYIDAAHTYDGIKNDTEVALRCISARSMIVWDDYGGWWTGVNRFLDELDAMHELVYIPDSRYVVYSNEGGE